MIESSISTVPEITYGSSILLKPYSGFIDDFQGKQANDPLAFTENGQRFDSLAAKGTPGYDPLLVKGEPVSVGQPVLLWIPMIGWVNDDGIASFLPYYLSVAWRLRNVFDNRNERIPYHIPKQGVGAPDTSGAVSQPRVPLPCAVDTIRYQQIEPVPAPGIPDFGRSVATDHAFANNTLLYPHRRVRQPRVGPGLNDFGVLQQGIIDPGSPEAGRFFPKQPMFGCVRYRSEGDEMIVCLWRDSTVDSPNWGFGDGEEDREMGVLYGNADAPDVGMYMMKGSSGSIER